jgi:1-acyl-sn-glycerol-3-phosphate acyltransferase
VRQVPIPPMVVRRVVLAPLIVLITVVVIAFLPLLVLGASFVVRWLPGRWRGLRLLWFLLVYLVRESVGLTALFALWVLSGFGWRLRSDWMQRAHVFLVGWYLNGLVVSARRVMGLEVVTEEGPRGLRIADPLHEGSGDGSRPVLVFSRHAGAGDSFLLVELLVNAYGRRPRIVLKDQLQFDPCVDVVLNRLPNRFISPNPLPGAGVVESIADLAAGLEDDGALILFPEGGNFSEERRRRAIRRLGEEGLEDLVSKAQELTQVLPPRPGGALAAIDAARAADVLFVAHTGLEQLSSLRDIWNGLPMRRQVRMTWWTVPAEHVPTSYAERVVWLYAWWEHMDTWIERRVPPKVPSGPKLAPAPDGTGTGPER